MLFSLIFLSLLLSIQARYLDCYGFEKNELGYYENTTCLKYPYEDYAQHYDYETFLFKVLPRTDLSEFISLVGIDNAREALNLTGSYFDDAITLYSLNDDDLVFREDMLYTEQIPSWTIKTGGPSSLCRINLPSSWERCYLQSFYYKNKFTANLIGMYYGVRDKAPEWAKSLWSFYGKGQVGSTIGLTSIGSYFVGSKAKKECTSIFIVTDDKFNIVSAGGGGDAMMLVGVIPRTKGTGNCDTKTGQQDIINEIAAGMQRAGNKAMTTFCITITGKPGWFGSNNWYGQIKFMAMKESRDFSFAEIPCKEYLLGGRWFNGDWFKNQYVGDEINL